MKPLLPTVTFVLLAAFPVQARPHETFAGQPAKRQEKVRSARERTAREKEAARTWAATRGIPMRRDDGYRVRELMAVRDGRPVYYVTLNEDAAISSAADQVRNTMPYNVTGLNVTVGVWDGGNVYAAHREFSGRVTLKDPSSPYGVHYHPTHVAGTIGAAGIDSAARGMAPAVLIHSYDWSNDESEMTAVAAASAGESGKIYLSNHSYGTPSGWDMNDDSGTEAWHWPSTLPWTAGAEDDYFGQYSASTRWWDEIAYNAPYYLPFKSAGNDRNDNPAEGTTVYYYDNGWQGVTYTNALHPKGDGQYKNGYDTILPKGNAKNIMTVGAVSDAVSGSSRSLANADITTFSGWGPADDGRIKPDIVANGYQLYSCDKDNTSDYIIASGTSMSAPNASGSAALLVDYFDDLFPGSAMRASTLKGLIIHTADDLGNPGPDYSYGWGLINTWAAAELLADFAQNPVRLTEETVTAAEQSDHYVLYGSGADPIRVTLCWTDPPGAATSDQDNRSPRLVNDLDISITGPGGTFHPYTLDYNHPSQEAATATKNSVDNVEQIYIPMPIEGKYTITINYDGALTGGTQWYSLLVSGLSGDADDDGLPDYWEIMHFSNPTGAVASVDSDGDGADNLAEYVSGHIPTDPASRFKVAAFEPPPAGYSPLIISWPTVEGRLYSIAYADSLLLSGFSMIPDAVDLPYTRTSYTDSVERIGPIHFYRVEVRMDP